MIKEFVERFDANRDSLRDSFRKYCKKETYGDYESEEWSIEYADIVREVVEVVKGEEYGGPDPERIHEIDDGDYQGTLLYVIASDEYQPSDYWYVKVIYGSCSGCDTLLGIIEGCGDMDEKLDDLMILALHIVQGLKKLGGD